MALIEYCGYNNTARKPSHGNSKSGEPYTRTDPAILQRAFQQSNHKKATEIVNDMCLDDSVSAPKCSRQVQDKIYRESKKHTQTKHTSHRNIADELLDVMSAIHTNPYIQEVTLTKNKQPIVIVYSDEQLKDIKNNCIGGNGSILGVDRTFNLGKKFVTSFSYKNRSVISRKTDMFPIMLGPTLIHWDGEQATYSRFFSHLRDRLGKVELTIGSDEEKAMTNALHDNFHNSTFLLCTKHLKDNIRRFLEKNGSDQWDREKIIKVIFNSKDGIVFSKDDIVYSKRVDDIAVFFQRYPKFGIYWQRYFEPKLRKFVYEPLRNGGISKLWTNNNSESINNRLKQVAEWNQHKILELVDRISKVSTIQLIDLRRALYGSGNYRLVDSAHAIPADIWHAKTHSEKEKIFENFLKAPVKSTNMCTESKLVKAASAPKFQLIRPKVDVGKKPGQKSRPKSERTNVHR